MADENTVNISKEELDFLINILNRLTNGGSVSEADKLNLVQMKEKDLGARIRSILLNLGVRQGIKGYEYLKTAIKLGVEDPSVLTAVTTRLYPGVAKVHNTTATRVERAIRHAVELAFDNPGGEGMKLEVFGNSTDWNRGKPMNSHFIAGIVEYLKET